MRRAVRVRYRLECGHDRTLSVVLETAPPKPMWCYECHTMRPVSRVGITRLSFGGVGPAGPDYSDTKKEPR